MIASDQVSVTAFARLHMGFIDLSGALGRRFGSIGVAIDDIATRLTLTPADECRVVGPGAARILDCLRRLQTALHLTPGCEVVVSQLIPEHVGLGSGTQLALALGAGLAALYRLNLSVRDIAQLTDRGGRSGIGIGVFEQGGLVVDGGRGAHTQTPPVIARLDFPEAWRFILVFDERGQGLHGDQERWAFEQLPAFPAQQAAELCYRLFMQGLPALVERDIDQFGAAITHLQHAVGSHFANAQGGLFTSPDVADAIDWLAQQGAVGLGQTSWGPTGFCLVASETAAERLVLHAARQFSQRPHLRFEVCRARNQGAILRVT